MKLSPLQRYILRKAGWYFLTFLAAVSLNFFLPRLIPGNPVNAIIAKMATGGVRSEQLEKLYTTFMQEFGLDKPLPVQFLRYVGGVFRGDLGTSFSLYPKSVSSILGEALPWTLALQVPAILCGWILGNCLGVLAACRGGKTDGIVFPAALFVNAIPFYCVAIILQYILAVSLGWFPVGMGYGAGVLPSFSFSFLRDLGSHYALPFLSIVFVTIGGQAIGMREMSLYELDADYVRYAEMLGFRDRKVIRYVFRNAMLPQVTGLALSLGMMVGGSLITEIVFSYPGVGTRMFEAIRQLDYPMIQGATLVITVSVLLANFSLDSLYGVLDPRIRAAREDA